MNREIRVLADADAVARSAAAEFRVRAAAAIAAGGRFTVALSGGHTPVGMFEALAADAPGVVEWERVQVFWADERTVPPTHPDSNFGAANRLLLARVGAPEGNVHRMVGEAPEPSQAAAAYEATLRRVVGTAAPRVPRLDLVLLGMGADGHTASLFPGSEALGERTRLVAAPWVEKLGSYRLTLTLPILEAAACVIFLVTGPEKAETLARVLDDQRQSAALPAQAVRPRDGKLLWLVDVAAAEFLRRAPKAGE